MPPINLDEIGKKLSRLFLGRISIKELRSERTLNIKEGLPSKSVNVITVRTETRVNSACFVEWQTMKCQGVNTWSAKENIIPIHACKIEHSDIVSKTINLKRHLRVKEGTRWVRLIPQQRINRIQFMKNKPALDKAILLGIFSPIVENMLKKSFLDKKSGKLLLTYESFYNGEQPKHLALFRFATDPSSSLKWVWLPKTQQKH